MHGYRLADSLQAAPKSEKVKKLEMIKKAKYRAMTARSNRDRVMAPWYLVNRLMMIGKRKPKSAEMVGGKTPETIEKVLSRESLVRSDD